MITLIDSIVAIFLIFYLFNQVKSSAYMDSGHVIEANESESKSKQEPSKINLAFAGYV